MTCQWGKNFGAINSNRSWQLTRLREQAEFSLASGRTSEEGREMQGRQNRGFSAKIAMIFALVFVMIAMPAGAQPAHAACKNSGSFSKWLNGFRREAIATGIKKQTVRRALANISYDPSIIRRDRRQSIFALSFLQFSDKLATIRRQRVGRKKIKKHRAVYNRAQKEFGVPPEVITAFWALESDFGTGMGNLSVLRSLATLAYDCRRGPMFRRQLMAALQIIERGDLSPKEMIGSWAGELGQTQMMPEHYLRDAIDYDGDGHANLFRSVTDIIGSTGKYLKYLGWRKGQPWIEEVRVPKKMDWKEADLAIQHTRSQWAKWGVRRANGKPLIEDGMEESLLLPMGRFGPAFLAYHNFRVVYLKWNESFTYSLTAAYLATRIGGAKQLRRGPKGLAALTYKQNKLLQRILTRMGYDVGAIDGKLGAKSRAAVKAVQIRLGLPADSFPTPSLLRRLQRRS